MFKARLHKNESGQTALETAIILIAFVVVASVFAFTILSAGTASTERGEQAIYSGLEGVQSSLTVRGAVVAEADDTTQVDTITFTLATVAGGEPVNLDDTNPVVVIGYRDATVNESSITWAVSDWIVSQEETPDNLLEEGELAEITVTLPSTVTLGINTAFSLEIKPPTGGVLQINRTTPSAIDAVMELR